MTGEPAISEFLDGRVVLHGGDSRELIKRLPPASIDAVVCDPPYALVSIVKRFGKQGAATAKGNDAYTRASAGFMGKQWDTGEVAFDPAFWVDVMRVLKPGGHLVAFSGTRSYHRLACAIEDAGFEIRDQLAWVYGSGFPKSHDVAKAIDKAAGHWRGRAGPIVIEEQPAKGKEYERTDKGEPVTAAAAWEGWGTALKPAWEPIVLARKAFDGTVAENVLKHGTGAINIDGCRVSTDDVWRPSTRGASGSIGTFKTGERTTEQNALGRWPANIVHDGSDEVVAGFPDTTSGFLKAGTIRNHENQIYGKGASAAGVPATLYDQGGDSGSAARYFYTAKADGDERIGSKHPTVKPVDLMQWLVRLVCPKGGVVLDPFAGSGTTGEAAWREGCRAVLFEREAEYQTDIARRMEMALQPKRVRKTVTRKAVRAAEIDDSAGEGLFAAL